MNETMSPGVMPSPGDVFLSAVSRNRWWMVTSEFVSGRGYTCVNQHGKVGSSPADCGYWMAIGWTHLDAGDKQ